MYPNLEHKLSAANNLESIRLIRYLSLEGLGDYAILRLKELCPNLSHDSAIKILLGYLTVNPLHQLSQINDDSLVDEESHITEKFQKDLSFIYRGVFKQSDGKFLRPYAYIKSYCMLDAVSKKRQQELVMAIINKHYDYDEDKHWNLLSKEFVKAGKAKKTLFDRYQKDPLYRAKHYANKDTDTAIYLENIKMTEDSRLPCYFAALFEEIEGVPSFFELKNTSAESAYLDIQGNYDDIKEYGSDVSYNNFMANNPALRSSWQNQALQDNNLVEDFYKVSDTFVEFINSSNEKIMREMILERSQIDKYGMIDLEDKEGKLLASVPRLPFLCWSLNRTIRNRNELPKYETVSVSGMKLSLDCPYHTDWMLGGGLDLDKDYSSSSEIQNSAIRMSGTIQNYFFDFEHTVLASGNKVSGKIKHCNESNAHEVEPGDIVIIPTGSPAYQLHVEAAIANGEGGVIAVVGNRVAHLTKVSRERGVTMMQNDDAFSIFPEGMKVTLDPKHGRIEIK